ncbi:flagellar protein FlaG [Thermoanaerobacterium sp. DL9XJH110]|uniref:flagellar protein FlaG n=1 Tax=Thermoanaerobacterium sp. DL9XJH110 TaxID=3386643 RepID=UPI003BB7DA83
MKIGPNQISTFRGVQNILPGTDSKEVVDRNNYTKDVASEIISSTDKKVLSNMELDDAVRKINDTIRIFDRRYHFKIDEDSDKIIVQIINNQTGEIIREVPPEEVLKLAARIKELLGLFVDERR